MENGSHAYVLGVGMANLKPTSGKTVQLKKVVNSIINVDESNVWHSRLCHVNFDCMMRLADLSLIPKFTFVKILCVMYVLNLNRLASHTSLRRRETWHH